EHLAGAPARHRGIVPMQHRADDDIVLDRKRWERPHQLEGAANAAAADLVGGKSVDAVTGEGDRTAVGRGHAGDDVEQRGLAGTVGADDCEDRALRHAKAHIVDRKQPAKALADRVDGQEGGHARRPVTPSLPASHGHTPSGNAITTTSRQSPKKTCLAPEASRPSAVKISCMVSDRPVRRNAPMRGPNRVPMPPMIGPKISSIEREMWNTCSGNRML